jgi:hypothetical protein
MICGGDPMTRLRIDAEEQKQKVGQHEEEQVSSTVSHNHPSSSITIIQYPPPLHLSSPLSRPVMSSNGAANAEKSHRGHDNDGESPWKGGLIRVIPSPIAESKHTPFSLTANFTM